MGLDTPVLTVLVTCQACGETHNDGINQLLEPRFHQANLDIHEISCTSAPGWTLRQPHLTKPQMPYHLVSAKRRSGLSPCLPAPQP